MSLGTYETIRTHDLEGRELEAWVLSRAARQLGQCERSWNLPPTPGKQEQLQDALEFTQRLWTFLQVEVSTPGNPLPESVRKGIYRLSRYVDQTITELQAGGTIAQLRSLIRVNQELAAGLGVTAEPPVCGVSCDSSAELGTIRNHLL